MAVIAIYSIKGGVGKTTMAVDLAWRSATVQGKRTLIWDLDPQGGAGFLLGYEAAAAERASAAFLRDNRVRDAVVPTAWPDLSLLPADRSLRQLPLQLPRLGPRKLANMASYLRIDFDRIFLDCPAGANEVTEQAVAAADLLIVPLPASPLSARALDQLRTDLLRRHRRHPPILPVLSMHDGRRPLHRAVRDGAAANWPVVPLAAQLEMTAVNRAPLGTFTRYTDVGRALKRLSDGIEARLAQTATPPVLAATSVA